MKRFLVLSVLLLAAPAARGQWVQMKGHSLSHMINAFAVNGPVVFVGTGANWNKGNEGDIYRSTDSGMHWRAVPGNWPNVSALLMCDSNLFAGTSGGGVFRSTNFGKHWIASDSGLINSYGFVGDINTLAASGSILFVGFDGPLNGGGDLFRSTNSGESWTPSNSGLPVDGMVRSFAKIGNNLFVGTNHGIYVSTNDGINWSEVNNGLPMDNPPTFVDVLSAGGKNLFAVLGSRGLRGAGGGVFCSTNNGASWAIANTGLPDNGSYVSSFAVVGTTIFAADFGIYRSTNNGAAWSELNTGLPKQSTPWKLLAYGNYLYAGTQEGFVWRRKLSEIMGQ